MRSISPSIARVSTEAMARRPVAAIFGFDLVGRFAGRHTINAFAVGLLRYQRQAELLAHDTGKEAADRVLLPAGRLHDGGDRCPLGLSEQGEDRLLFGPAAGRTEGVFPGFAGFFARLLARANLVLVGVLLCDISDPFGCDGNQRRHHRSPTVAASPAGQDPGWGQAALIIGSDTDAPFAAEVQSFLPFDPCIAVRDALEGIEQLHPQSGAR